MNILVIGGTAAGTSAAAKAKRLMPNATVKILEQTDVLSFGACGLPYYVGDFFDDETNMIARTKEQFEKSGIIIEVFHQVTGIDETKKEVYVQTPEGKKTERYDQLMIATGAKTWTPPFVKKEYENLFHCKVLKDGLALKKALLDETKKEVVIIGGGFIGLELVEGCLKLGKRVRLIEMANRLMAPSFDEDCTDLFYEELVKHGVDVHLGERVEELKGETFITKVQTDKGSYESDIVILATGFLPATDFLPDTFNRLKNGALVIDEYGKTNVKDVYAAGDCATIYNFLTKQPEYTPLATYANKMGRIVGENLAGKKVAFQGALGSTGLQVIDLQAGKTGLTKEQLDTMQRPYKTVTIKDKNQTDYYPGQQALYGKLHYDPETKEILGAQIIGPKGAVLRIDVLAAAIFKKMTTEELGFLDLIYAPPFARTWDFLNVLGNVAK